MKILAVIVSFLGLALVLLPSILYLASAIDKANMNSLMLVGTIVWFVAVPFWMDRKKS
jgi:hypothetical protein